MSAAESGLLAFALAAGAALVMTPLAIRVAWRFEFFDSPGGYKEHSQPTAYLGGSAVVSAFLIALVSLSDLGRTWPVVSSVLVLFVLGTVDDRRNVGPLVRVLAELAVAAVIWNAGLGWHVLAASWGNLMLTLLWVVGIVNAFNLMDNLDGAAGTVGAVSGAGMGILGIAQGSILLAVVGFGLSGGCLGFLRLNLAKPAKIFLGDGGSMPLGLVAAVAAMVAASTGWGRGGVGVLAAGLFVGLVILDTTLVTVSRTRRHASLLSGGRDHLTHRLLARLGSTARVAVVLALAQFLLATLAVISLWAGETFLGVAAVSCVLVGVGAIVTLDMRWSEVPGTRSSDRTPDRAPASAGPVGNPIGQSVTR